MKNITNAKETGTILSKGGFRWVQIPDSTTRLTRRNDGLFEFCLHRGHDITQTKDTIAHQLIEAAKSQSCILAIAEAKYENVGPSVGDALIVVRFTLERKDESKGSPSAPYRGKKIHYNALGYSCIALQIYGVKTRVTLERAIDERLDDARSEFSETGQYLGTTPTKAEADALEGQGRQCIGVYVDNDEDAALVLEALRRLREGGPATRPFNQPFNGISSLD